MKVDSFNALLLQYLPKKEMVLRSPMSLGLEEKSAARKSPPQLREHIKHIKVCILVAEDNIILLCTGKSVKQAKG